MVVIRNSSIVLKVIKYSSVLFLVLFFVFGVFLFLGIKIDSFSFGNFSVSKLYLKYDKKLILEIDKLDFLTNKSSTKLQNNKKSIYETISNIPTILKLFKKIDIERLNIKDSAFTFTLNENYIYLDNNDINLSSSLSFAGSQVTMDIDSLYLKKTSVTFFGKAKVDTYKQLINFFGSYDYKYVEGELNIQLKDDLIDFFINTTKNIKSISFLKDFFRLDEVAEAWMYDNVTGDIDLNFLYGRFDIKKMKLDENSMKGNVTIKNAKIQFHKDAKPVDTPLLTIDYKHNGLYFDLKDPMYNKSSIEGSKVYITDLTSLKKGTVFVDLKTKSILNEDILEILKAYKINLPLRQLDGETNSSLLLKIPYSIKRKMEVSGAFDVKNANMRLNNFDFFAKYAKVTLKDNIVDITDSSITHKDMIDTLLKLKIDTKSHTASGNAKISKFQIKSDDTNIVYLENFNTPLDIDFNKTTKIDIKALKTILDINKEKVKVNIDDVNSVYSYSDVLKKSNIKSGELDVDIFDENNIKFYLSLNNLAYPIYLNGNKVEKLFLIGNVNSDKTVLYTEDKSIEIELKRKNPIFIKLTNYDIDLSKSDKKVENDNLTAVDLSLNNSSIRLDEKHFYKVNWANIHLENKNIDFSAESYDLDLPISKNDKKVTKLNINGNFKDDFLKIKSHDSKLELDYDLKKDKMIMNLNGYDVIYNTMDETDEKNITVYYINGKNSSIIINKKHKAIATKYNFIFEKNYTDINLLNNSTKFKFHKDNVGSIVLNAINMNDEFLNQLFGKRLIQGGVVNVTSKGKNGIIKGNADIKDSKVVDLAILNNLLILINTSPGLINPLLAIPSVVGMATNDGFNLNGYRIVEGTIDFTYNTESKYLNMNKVFTKGNGIDFDGFITIDFKTSKIDSKMKLVFFKNYSKIVGSIPVINYILLGDENRVSTQVEIYGTIDDPQYKTVFVEEGVKAPVNVLKRIILSPLKLFESSQEDIEEEKKKE